MKPFVQWVVRHRIAVLVAVGLITVLLGSQIRNLRIVIDPVAMLPKAHPNVVGTNLAEAVFGSKYVVVVGISAADGGTALRPEVLEVVDRLTKSLSAVAGVKRHTVQSVAAEKAKSITGSNGEMQVQPLLDKPITDTSARQLGSRIEGNPFYQGTLLSKDKTVTALSFSVDIGPKGFREVVDKVLAVTDRAKTPTVQINVSGTPVFFATVERFAQRMAFLFPIALVLIGLIHFEAFRTLQGMLLPLFTAVLAVVWSIGFMGWLNVPLDAFNATTPILILAVAAGHAVQILKRYYEEYDRIRQAFPSDSPRVANDKAIIESLTRIGPVMLAAGFVAAAGFFSLISFEITTIRTFGIITGLGVLCALVIELTLIPALRSCLRPPPVRLVDSTNPVATRWDRFADRLVSLVLSSPKQLAFGFLLLVSLSVSAFLALFSTWAGSYLPFEKIGYVINELVSFAFCAGLFVALMRMSSGPKPQLRYLVVGAAVGAVLFAVGKHLMTLYLSTAAVVSAYGAAGSLVVILMWIYFSSAVLLLAASVARSLADEALASGLARQEAFKNQPTARTSY